MKNSKVIELNKLLKNTDFNDIKDSKFQYCITRNIRVSDVILESLQKDIDKLKPEVFINLQTEIKNIINKHITDNPKDINTTEFDLIRKWDKYSEWVTVNNELTESLKPIYDTESEFKIFTLKFNTLPELNQNQMNAIYDLIDTNENTI